MEKNKLITLWDLSSFTENSPESIEFWEQIRRIFRPLNITGLHSHHPHSSFFSLSLDKAPVGWEPSGLKLQDFWKMGFSECIITDAAQGTRTYRPHSWIQQLAI